jgi:hypothetical protein
MKTMFEIGDLVKFRDKDVYVGTKMGEQTDETDDTIIGPYPKGYFAIVIGHFSISEKKIKILVDGQAGWVFDYEIKLVRKHDVGTNVSTG